MAATFLVSLYLILLSHSFCKWSLSLSFSLLARIMCFYLPNINAINHDLHLSTPFQALILRDKQLRFATFFRCCSWCWCWFVCSSLQHQLVSDVCVYFCPFIIVIMVINIDWRDVERTHGAERRCFFALNSCVREIERERVCVYVDAAEDLILDGMEVIDCNCDR